VQPIAPVTDSCGAKNFDHDGKLAEQQNSTPMHLPEWPRGGASPFFVEQATIYVGPELVEGAAGHSASDPLKRSDGRVVVIRFTISPPSIREEVVAGNGDEASIGRGETSVGAAGRETTPEHISHTRFERLLRHTEITRVLAPESADACLDRVSRRYAGEAHAETVTEASPARPEFLRPIDRSTEGGTHHAGRKVLRTGRIREKPPESLAASDRIVRRILPLRLQWGEQRRLMGGPTRLTGLGVVDFNRLAVNSERVREEHRAHDCTVLPFDGNGHRWV
jgi:hypothetical protein